ncbi:serine protease [Mariprofundus ferrooxydans]|uniref:DNA/RNA non-specific endonuclease n=1 Tax=Mariprofundus ferrooxydans PV-1 TaxID=314345 RepID=Q0EZU3_9PROT|nr:serine protease [Mariprofundus ferrooxydans]EAU54941.1 DNA/RNA non-specific endonuclease [Mariprofundus ferrooxydans PV-1]
MNTLITEVKEAADSHEVDRLSAACTALIAQLPQEESLIDVETARDILGALRKSRRFEHMRSVAEAIVREGCEDPQVKRQYAQALIESGETTPAIGVLDQLIPTLNQDPLEQAEIYGLKGRAWKEIALSAKRIEQKANAFKEAHQAYHAGYELDREKNLIWHGINLVAIANADRVGALELSVKDEAIEIANRIVDFVDNAQAEEPDAWNFASAGEALVALGRTDESLEWFKKYVAHEKTDAFELAGTIRQLKELYNLEEVDGGTELLAPLRARLLQMPGGNFTLSNSELREMSQVGVDQFQKVLGSTGTKTYEWMMRALNCAGSVALISANGEGIGTGFLVLGSDLDPRLGDELFVLTNSHVVSDPPQHGAASIDDVSITFELANKHGRQEQIFGIEKIVWGSPPDQHDVSILKLTPDPSESFLHLPLARDLPLIEGGDIQRVYIIGHPRGGKISFSLEDNELLDYDMAVVKHADTFTACRVHYRAPTEPGSSGSPVFNGNWKTIALHHMGGESIPRLNGRSGTYAANEGIWLQSIVRAIRHVENL